MGWGLITSTDVTTLTGQYSLLFDTLTHNRTRTITVFKEPIKVLNTGIKETEANYVGYEDQQYNTNINDANNYYSYTPVSGVFPAIIRYGGRQSIDFLGESKNLVDNSEGKIKIKVETDCYNYIMNGKTENIKVDDLTCNISSNPSVQDYLGLKYYNFYLSPTN